jgi:integrase
MVISTKGGYEIKNLPKTISSVRKVYIPDKLAEEIRKKGYIYKGSPGQILKALHRTQDRLGIPRSRFHDLRHYFVSYAHSLGWADADIIAITGHKTDEIAKRVYRHSMADYNDKKNLANMILE